MRTSRTSSIASVVGSAFVWGTSFAVSKLALRSIPPLWLAWIRFVLASTILLVWLLFRHENLRLDRRAFGAMMLGGVLGYALNHLFENVGLVLSTASEISLMMGVFPVLSLLVEGLAYHRRFSHTTVAGIALSVVGVVLIVDPRSLGGTLGGKRLLGDGLIILSGICWAFYSILVKNLSTNSSASRTAMFQMAFGSVVLLPLAGVFERPVFPVPAAAVWAVIYLAVFCSVGGYSLYNYGVARMASTQAVNILNLIPVFGVLTSWVVLHETVTVMQLAGGAVVLLGVLLSLRDSSLLASPS
ncbi:DMT family transporter [Candidatus Cryosericum terrychapinii]|uniref:EamA/RhaT family transporter n=1 Tax=Candidatus Cryosericum terrychapinii TaxID=2290919 RepID=A0A398D4B7_9BACT|nr:EamA family transporter [Candidatus Cryosericum terrychapinii]RIE05944.1 EamA/RhaT family transporter [Candidatus Cryosericum terrychapinii]